MADLAGSPWTWLSVTAGADGDALRVRLGGELDLASLPDVQPRLDGLPGREPQPIPLDPTDLRFLDSSGIAVLSRSADRVPTVRLGPANAAVRRVIEVLGLTAPLGQDRS